MYSYGYRTLPATEHFLLQNTSCRRTLPATEDFLLQNSSCYRTVHATEQFLLQNSSCYRTLPATEQFLLQNSSCHRTLPATRRGLTLEGDDGVLFPGTVRRGWGGGVRAGAGQRLLAQTQGQGDEEQEPGGGEKPCLPLSCCHGCGTDHTHTSNCSLGQTCVEEGQHLNSESQ